MHLMKNMQQDKTGIQVPRKGCGNWTREPVTSENKSSHKYIHDMYM